MRQHNKYLEKVYEEMDVFRRHLILGEELSPQQTETFNKIDIARAWLKEGNSDTQVIRLLKNDPSTNLQDRRAREILSMAYEVFAELRRVRSKEGIKLIAAEDFKEAAKLCLDEARKYFEYGDPKAGADLMKQYKALRTEAAKIDGAYDNSGQGVDGKKKPTKVNFKRVTIMQNGEQTHSQTTEEAEYELED